MSSLSNDLISQFIKSTNDTKPSKKESIVYGTITNDEKDACTVKFDGSDKDTPVETTSTVKVGDRVMVTIKNHTAIVTGNLSDRSASSKEFSSTVALVADYGKFKTLTTENFVAVDARIEALDADLIDTKDLIAKKATIEQLNATNARIDSIVAGDITAGLVTTEQLNAALVDTNKLIAQKADVTVLNGAIARIGEIESNYVKTSVLEANYTTTKILDANYAKISLLESDYVKTSVLEADYVKAASIAGKYANIDFSNITKATMQWFYANSGLIKDVVVGDSTITGELVGVTIAGDLIKGNTVKADKLVIKGSDGLYYKLNFDAGTFKEGETVPNDSLHGSIITAKSITAEKVSVKDLVAFGATIGGFTITDNSLYSGVKKSATNTTRGIYLDSTGQIAIGDASNYLKYFKDTDGRYKLDISAQSVSLKSGDTTTNIEDAFDDVKAATVVDTTVMYALSDSLTTEPTSGWSAVAPEWTTGKYMWQKTVTTYGNGTTKESDPTCISGANGKDGTNGEDATVLRIDSSRGTVFKNNTVETVLSVVVYNGPHRITDITTLKSIYGSGAYLQWSWQKMNENKFGDIVATDSRIGSDGFTFTLSADDVDAKVVFMCSLII